MGAEYVSYKVKAKSVAELNEKFDLLQKKAQHNYGYSYSGNINMATGLKIDKKIFKEHYSADNYIADTAEKWGPAIAVEVTTEKETYYLIGAWCSS